MKHKEKTQQYYLDGQREEVDLLEGLDLAVLDQTSKLGDRDPFLRKIKIKIPGVKLSIIIISFASSRSDKTVSNHFSSREYKVIITRSKGGKISFKKLHHLLLLAPATSPAAVSAPPTPVTAASASPANNQFEHQNA